VHFSGFKKVLVVVNDKNFSTFLFHSKIGF
jgi:hypothetical protein